jgi:arylsulfatase A-like enzyme
LLAEPNTKRPNLVFFLGEGQRADALSIAGNPILKTPNHDRIGREGMRFENALCTNALCAPARAVALSGMYSRSTGVLSNQHLNVPMPTDIPLFTDILHDAGYEVAILGKVHLPNGAEERYWDYYFGHNDPANNYANPFFKEGREGKIGPEKQYRNVYPDDLTVDRALAWLEKDRGTKPFCLLVLVCCSARIFLPAPAPPGFISRNLDSEAGDLRRRLEWIPRQAKGFCGCRKQDRHNSNTPRLRFARRSREGLLLRVSGSG